MSTLKRAACCSLVLAIGLLPACQPELLRLGIRAGAALLPLLGGCAPSLLSPTLAPQQSASPSSSAAASPSATVAGSGNSTNSVSPTTTVQIGDASPGHRTYDFSRSRVPDLERLSIPGVNPFICDEQLGTGVSNCGHQSMPSE